MMFVTNVVSQKNCLKIFFCKLFIVTTFTTCTVTIAGEITSGLVRGASSLQGEVIILKQEWMRLSRDVSSNQDNMTPAWPGDHLTKCPGLCFLA